MSFSVHFSSSYSSAALEFEKEHKINPVYDSPRMSRRSLRLQTSAGFYVDGSFADLTPNHNVSSYKRSSTSSVSRSDDHLSLSLCLCVITDLKERHHFLSVHIHSLSSARLRNMGLIFRTACCFEYIQKFSLLNIYL